MKQHIYPLLVIAIFLSVQNYSSAQKKSPPADTLLSSSTFSGLAFRNVGPAFMSGRIADIAIHPEDENTWYIGVGSGGVWKTVNAGTTWTPLFDRQVSYSIGCITIDPANPHVVWVGTGENIGGRHVGYGDGIYKSEDGGLSWKNMGLKESQHISKIIIHPENSDIMWVAAQGPLWNKGDERGLYKSTDGGTSWNKTLGDDEWIGVTDIAIDPRDPDLLYAATWQRHRNIAAYMGGGPGTGLHKSTDGGETWKKLTGGLPTSNMGKIGLAISPQEPDILYAAIELDRRTGGVFKSTNRGETWIKQSEAVSGATGPHYYQELYACPHNFDRIYLCDVRIQLSKDGGKTFNRLTETHKHSDNHAIAFRKDDPDYLLVGTDGGLYESFDEAQNWRYMANLPLTQYYKLAVDDAEPFYNIYGGTQDNATQGGPSMTDSRQGIHNADWYVLLGGDGHQPATEPGNPNIVYAQSQEGELHRVDKITGEKVYIKPQPGPGEDYERNNWDAPILVSPHSPTRIYFASQRLWKSENRGDSWEAISEDLTRNQERITLPIMEKTWSWDSPWDFNAMSNYNTITSIAESPLKEGLIYIGTDDGLIQVTEDGGANWLKIEVGSLPGVPETSYVNDIKADLFDENTLYIALDNHKFGDLDPYLLKSTDKGQSWTSLKGDLPDRTLVWRIVQDHVKPELLFAATEFGIYFTIDGGNKWIKFSGGLPTIPFRDLAIQKRENDLIGASFGRSFFVLDDYSALRDVSLEKLEKEATLFNTHKTWWYVQKQKLGYSEKGSQGASFYTAPNPPYGAVFTYYLKDSYKTQKEQRKEEEQKLIKEDKNVSFPGWEAVESEVRQVIPKVQLIVKDLEGNVIRIIDGPVTKGFHRVAWDLRYSSVNAININYKNSDYVYPGILATPGTYTVTLVKKNDGIITELSGPEEFELIPLRQGALEGSTYEEFAQYREEVEQINSGITASTLIVKRLIKKTTGMQKALTGSRVSNPTLDSLVHNVQQDLLAMEEKLYGKKSKDQVGEKTFPALRSRLRVASAGCRTTYGPTPMHRESLNIVQNEYRIFKLSLEQMQSVRMPALERKLWEAGAPWVEGQEIP